MLIIELTYIKPIEEVERYLEAHRAFLGEHYSSGVFIASGPKVPREGGVILANCIRDKAENLIQQDPFYVHDIADYRMVEFTPNRYSDEFRCIVATL